jgi:hypothetical protein
MYVKYTEIERLAQDLLHLIDSEPTARERMILAADAQKMLRQRLIDLRNEAAYAARDGVTTTKLQELTGIERGTIESWSRTWADKKGLPLRRNRINRPWEVGYKDLSGE